MEESKNKAKSMEHKDETIEASQRSGNPIVEKEQTLEKISSDKTQEDQRLITESRLEVDAEITKTSKMNKVRVEPLPSEEHKLMVPGSNFKLNQEEKTKLKKILQCKEFDTEQMSGKSQAEISTKVAMINKIKRISKGNNEANEDDSSQSEDDNIMKTDEFDPGATSQYENKVKFRKNYGIETHLPNMYILDAQIYPLDINYMIRVVNYVRPDDHYKVQNYRYIEGEEAQPPTPQQNISELLNETRYDSDAIMIQLYRNKGTHLSFIRETVFRTKATRSQISIKFSYDCKYLSLLEVQKSDDIILFKVGEGSPESAMTTLLENIENRNCQVVTQKDIEKSTTRFFWSVNSDHFAILNETTVSVYSAENSQAPIRVYNSHDKLIQLIYGVTLSEDENKVIRCNALALLSDQSIGVFAAEELQIGKVMPTRQIKNQEIPIDVHFCFSDDHKSVLITWDAKIMMIVQQDDGTFQHKVFQWLKERKKVGWIKWYGSCFVLCAHNSFDRGYKLYFTRKEDLKMTVRQEINLGQFQKVLDIRMDQTQSSNGVGEKMSMLSITDNSLEFFQLNPEEELAKKTVPATPDEQQIQEIGQQVAFKEAKFSEKLKLKLKEIQCQSARWPYVCYVNSENHIWLTCAHNHKEHSRIDLGLNKKNVKFVKIFISPNFDLFFVINKFRKKIHEVWSIDLNQVRKLPDMCKGPFRARKILEYSQEKDLGDETLEDIIVRPSDKKEHPLSNMSEIIFFLCKKCLFISIDGGRIKRELRHEIAYDFYQISSNNFLIPCLKTFQGEQKFMIKQVSCQYNTFTAKIEFETALTNDQLLTHMVDMDTQRVLLVFQTHSQNKSKYLQIFEIRTGKLYGKVPIQDDEVIGQIKSQQSKISKGHIYFGNNVFKIRYKVIQQYQKDKKIQRFVDKYYDIVDMRRGEAVMSKMPFLSAASRKQIYFASNYLKYRPIRIVIMPILHERRIYLGEQKEGHHMFTTSLEQKGMLASEMIAQINMTTNKMFVYTEAGVLVNRVDFNDLVYKYGEPIQVSANGLIFIFHKEEKKDQIHIFKLTKDGFIYQKSIDIEQEIFKYIKTYKEIATTQKQKEYIRNIENQMKTEYDSYFVDANTMFTFQINNKQDIVVQVSSKIDSILAQKYMDMLNPIEREIVKKVIKNLKTQELLKNLKSNRPRRGYVMDDAKADEKKSLLELIPESEIFKLSVKAQTILANPDDQDFFMQLNQFMEKQSFIFFTMCNDTKDLEENKLAENLFFSQDFPEALTPQFAQRSFTICFDRVVFWNRNKIWMIPLHNCITKPLKFDMIDLQIDEHSTTSYILYCYQGNNKHVISIRLQQQNKKNMILTWDLKNNCETQSLDFDKKAFTLQDRPGNLIVADGDKILVTAMNHSLKSYDFDTPKQKLGSAFNLKKGNRMDGINYNWLLMTDYLCLSFSFMTLVIRDNLVNNLPQEGCLDIEAYNYNINKKTFLTADNFVAIYAEHLKKILTYIEEIDPDLLDMLSYYFNETSILEQRVITKFDKVRDSVAQKIGSQNMLSEYFEEMNDEENKKLYDQKRVTPLKLAMSNNYSREIILDFMSKSKTDTSESINLLFPDLVGDKNFRKYVDSLPKQTLEMSLKTGLSVMNTINEQIVGVYPSITQFIDEKFYREVMKDDKENPDTIRLHVKIQGLKVDWILKEEGWLFLNALYNDGEDDTFRSETLQVIIEFLYIIVRPEIYKRRLSIYLVQLVLFFVSLYADNFTSSQTSVVLAWANLIVSIQSIFSMLKKIFFDEGIRTFKRIWSWFDLIYCIVLPYTAITEILFHSQDKLSALTSATNLNNQTRIRRYLEALLSVTIWGKFAYFLQLVDQIAPLINIILLIFKDIGWFLVVFCVALFAFANAFFLIGKNQVEFGGIKTADQPMYAKNMIDSIYYTYLLSLGNFILEDINKGDDNAYPDQVLLTIVFVFASFFMLIHLLNMLIAIMGETFGANNETKDIQQTKSHLLFVLKHWHFLDYIPNKKRVKYLISAVVVPGETPEMEMLGSIMKEFEQKLDLKLSALQNDILSLKNKTNKIARQ